MPGPPFDGILSPARRQRGRACGESFRSCGKHRLLGKRSVDLAVTATPAAVGLEALNHSWLVNDLRPAVSGKTGPTSWPLSRCVSW